MACGLRDGIISNKYSDSRKNLKKSNKYSDPTCIGEEKKQMYQLKVDEEDREVAAAAAAAQLCLT